MGTSVTTFMNSLEKDEILSPSPVQPHAPVIEPMASPVTKPAVSTPRLMVTTIYKNKNQGRLSSDRKAARRYVEIAVACEERGDLDDALRNFILAADKIARLLKTLPSGKKKEEIKELFATVISHGEHVKKKIIKNRSQLFFSCGVNGRRKRK